MVGVEGGATNFGFNLGEWDISTLAQANAIVGQNKYLDNFTWKAAVAVGWFELGTVFLVTVVHFALPFGESIYIRDDETTSANSTLSQSGGTLVLPESQEKKIHLTTTISCEVILLYYIITLFSSPFLSSLFFLAQLHITVYYSIVILLFLYYSQDSPR